MHPHVNFGFQPDSRRKSAAFECVRGECWFVWISRNLWVNRSYAANYIISDIKKTAIAAVASTGKPPTVSWEHKLLRSFKFAKSLYVDENNYGDFEFICSRLSINCRNAGDIYDILTSLESQFYLRSFIMLFFSHPNLSTLVTCACTCNWTHIQAWVPFTWNTIAIQTQCVFSDWQFVVVTWRSDGDETIRMYPQCPGILRERELNAHPYDNWLIPHCTCTRHSSALTASFMTPYPSPSIASLNECQVRWHAVSITRNSLRSRQERTSAWGNNTNEWG